MTREGAASEIKAKLAELEHDQLLAFLASINDRTTEELQEEAAELVDDIFNSEETSTMDEVEETHSDIVGIIEEIKAEAQEG